MNHGLIWVYVDGKELSTFLGHLHVSAAWDFLTCTSMRYSPLYLQDGAHPFHYLTKNHLDNPLQILCLASG
jgi:hypothetical protein